MQINTGRGGRGVYFKDPNGHLLENYDPNLIQGTLGRNRFIAWYHIDPGSMRRTLV
jgi:hypothetical protein